MDCPAKDCVLRTGESCLHWQAFRFPDPEDGQMVKQWDCSMNWATRMQYESLRLLEGNQAAVESMRNETVKRQDAFIALAVHSQEQRKIENG